MFKFYKNYILPNLIDRAMRSEDFNTTRKKVAQEAHGVVLEIGFGSGYNLPFYKNITKLYALEPSQKLFDIATERIDRADFPVKHLLSGSEEISLPNGSMDTVVATWTLCSVSNTELSLEEIKRVLTPGGKFIFVEHGLSPKKGRAWFQRLFTTTTKAFRGNCHLDRDIEKEILKSGFYLEKIEKGFESGRPLMYSYRGIAKKELS